MKTKNKTAPETSAKPTEPKKENEPVATTTASASPSTEKKNRFNLSFDLNADGSPDFSSIREGTKERVKEFLTDEKMRSAFGANTARPDTAQKVHPAAVKGLYFTLGMIEATVIPLFFKEIKPEIARGVFIYTEQELTLLEPPTVAILNKYADWFLKWQDEIALVTILSSITVQKIQACIHFSRIERAKNVTPANPEPVPPTPEPPKAPN